MKKLTEADCDAVNGGLQSTSYPPAPRVGPSDTVRDQIEAMRRQQERQMIIDMFGSQENVAA